MNALYVLTLLCSASAVQGKAPLDDQCIDASGDSCATKMADRNDNSEDQVTLIQMLDKISKVSLQEDASQSMGVSADIINFAKQLHAGGRKHMSLLDMSDYAAKLAQNVVDQEYRLTPTDSTIIQTMTDFINTMLDNSGKTHTEDQEEVNAARDVVQGCTDVADALLTSGSVATSKQTAETEGELHATCRTTEEVKYNDMETECAAYNAPSLFSTPQPDCLTKLTTSMDPANADQRQCFEATQTWLSDFQKWLTPLHDKSKVCKEKTDVRDTQHAECNTKQSKFESSSCIYESKKADACEAQDTCRAKSTAAFSATRERVTISETSRKAEYGAGKHALCYLAVLEVNETEKPQKFKECQDLNVSTSQLDITYPDEPAKFPCDPVSPQTCDSEWISAEYSSKSWFGKAPTATCQTCPTPAPPIEPTPAPAPAPTTPAVFEKRCTHDQDWTYILDYSDDRSVDDIPNDVAALAPGFANKNAFYIGNDDLEKLDISEAMMCAQASSDNCASSCVKLDESLYSASSACPVLNGFSSNVKKMIAAFSGQCKGSGVFMTVPDANALSFEGDHSNVKWQCGGYRNFYGSLGNWHSEGWGLTMYADRGAGVEFGWYSSHCGWSNLDVDTFQIKVKLQASTPASQVSYTQVGLTFSGGMSTTRISDFRALDSSGTNILSGRTGADVTFDSGSVGQPHNVYRWFDADKLWQSPWIDFRTPGSFRVTLASPVSEISSISVCQPNAAGHYNVPWTAKAWTGDGAETILGTNTDTGTEAGKAGGFTTVCATIAVQASTPAPQATGVLFKIYANSAKKWLKDGMNMFADDENSATTWEVVKKGSKYTFKAQSGTSQFDGSYMQANCGEKQPTAWKQEPPDTTSEWAVTKELDLTKDNTGVTLINENGQHACSNIHHTNPPTCSYSCDNSWTLKFVSQASMLRQAQAKPSLEAEAAKLDKQAAALEKATSKITEMETKALQLQEKLEAKAGAEGKAAQMYETEITQLREKVKTLEKAADDEPAAEA